MRRSKPFLATLIILSAPLLFWGCASFFASREPQSSRLEPTECPRLDLGESEQDCPWAAWVREVAEQPALAESLPDPIRISLQRDQGDSAILEAWGRSQNFDEGPKAETVPQPILSALASGLGVAVEQRGSRAVVHAGLIHTYGYLLSNLRTSFGYKRARWVSGRIEAGLRLPKDSLSPAACAQGDQVTLLSQLTYLLMRVTLRDEPIAWESWRPRLEGRTTPALRALKIPATQSAREAQLLPSGDRIEWVTDLVTLPADPRGGRLLVYSRHSAEGVRLITAFPVEADFMERKNHPVRPRYNAWVD
jgi:hypothetical protein